MCFYRDIQMLNRTFEVQNNWNSFVKEGNTIYHELHHTPCISSNR